MSANKKLAADWAQESTSPLIDQLLRPGLALLWQSYIRAYATGANIWDFALQAGRLYQAGMTGRDLRWLVAKGFARQVPETPGDDDGSTFSSRNDYFLNEHAKLILTPSGAALADHVFRDTAQLQGALSAITAVTGETAAAAGRHGGDETNQPAISAPKPLWNATRRELSLAGLIVKRFRVPARNQEMILSVFEEEDWAEHIHDPLPVTHEIDAPTRLHDAINRLNRCQINQLLRFHGDGKGTGVLWELSQPNLWRNRRTDSL